MYPKKSYLSSLFILFAFTCTAKVTSDPKDSYLNGIRPPASPLVTVDPYFSIWSMSDEAYADTTRHWTGKAQDLVCAIRVDGKVYRILGAENDSFTDTARQLSLNVLPTRTIYRFLCGKVEVEMTFTTPLLLDRLELLSRPVTYLSWEVKSADGKKHEIQVYLEASPRLAINDRIVPMEASKGSSDGVNYVRTGTKEQNVLGTRGDDVRIDWGYFYLAAPRRSGDVALMNYNVSREIFTTAGKLPKKTLQSATSNNFKFDGLVLCYHYDFGKVDKPAGNFIMLAYDDIFSVKYLGTNMLRPYWNADGSNTITKELGRAVSDKSKIDELCIAFDDRMIKDAYASGGKEYADLCVLAYRQCLSAHKLLKSPKGELFYMSKENNSNGCIGTVDVTYPSIPLILLYNNNIAKALLNFVFDYAESEKWAHKTWAPHDLGVYPDAYGQHYGDHMPLEESGNMLLLTAATVLNDGDVSYAQAHWEALTLWALYCVQHGQMPENQLCTDDFAGKLAHNVNLSAKSILAAGAYAKLASMLGKTAEAQAFERKAVEMAGIWKKNALATDHYKLAFDSPEDSWSQKYNLVWDKLLGLNLFEEEVRQREIEFYLGKMNRYGLPLDSRRQYTKTDWILWTATMAKDEESFRKFLLPVHKFYNETMDRVPLGDWIDTDKPTHISMIARSVVGAFFMKMYYDKKLQH